MARPPMPKHGRMATRFRCRIDYRKIRGEPPGSQPGGPLYRRKIELDPKLQHLLELRDAALSLLKTQGKEQNIGEKPITVANVDQLKLASRKTDTGHALEVWTTVGKATKKVLFLEWNAAGTSIYIVSFKRGEWETVLKALVAPRH